MLGVLPWLQVTFTGTLTQVVAAFRAVFDVAVSSDPTVFFGTSLGPGASETELSVC